MKSKAVCNLMSCQHISCFLLCVMNAINICWYRALEKSTVYTESLFWLQDYSGCLVLRAVWSTTSDHSGQWDSCRVEKRSPSRAAH